MFVCGVVAIEVWDTQFPVWAFVLALIICASPDACSAFYQLTGLLPIQRLYTLSLSASFRLSPISKLVLTSSLSLSSVMPSPVVQLQ